MRPKKTGQVPEIKSIKEDWISLMGVLTNGGSNKKAVEGKFFDYWIPSGTFTDLIATWHNKHGKERQEDDLARYSKMLATSQMEPAFYATASETRSGMRLPAILMFTDEHGHQFFKVNPSIKPRESVLGPDGRYFSATDDMMKAQKGAKQSGEQDHWNNWKNVQNTYAESHGKW